MSCEMGINNPDRRGDVQWAQVVITSVPQISMLNGAYSLDLESFHRTRETGRKTWPVSHHPVSISQIVNGIHK